MYSIDKLLQESHFGHRRPSGLASLTINYLILQFAVGMAASFGVLFIFHLGKDLIQGLTFAVAFFCFQRVVVAFAIPIVAKVISNIGYRWTMLIGLVAMALKYGFLTLVSNNLLWPLIPALILGGIAIPAYYLAYHALFIDDNDESKLGEQIGFITMIGRVAGVASPFFAGMLVESYGFPVMFGFAVLLILISVFPIMLMKHHKRHADTYSLKAVYDFVIKYPEISWSMFTWKLTDAIQGLFWSIYLFLILGSYIKFGLVGSVVAIVNSGAIYVFGKLYDRHRAKKIFLESSVIVSFTWIGRFLSTTPLFAVVSDAVNRLFSPPWWMKIRRRELLAGEEVDSLVFGVAHEYLTTFGVVFGWIVGYLILIATRGQWFWLVIPAVIGTLFSAWIIKDK